MKMNFFRANLQFLIQARDLAKPDPQPAAGLPCIPDEMTCMLLDLSAQELTQIIQYQSPSAHTTSRGMMVVAAAHPPS
jgi:hypothetical protein